MQFAPFFNAQFVGDNGLPLAGGRLYTYASGTTTNLTTYSDAAGQAANTNPIVLDAAGRCDLRLSLTAAYTFVLKRPDGSTVKTWDGVEGVVSANGVVRSINGATGVVVLRAENVPFTTGTTTTWFSGTDIAGALDSIIARENVVVTAVGVTTADAGNYYTTDNVEASLQQIGGQIAARPPLPAQAGNNGKFLTTDGATPSWAAVATTTTTTTTSAVPVVGNYVASPAAVANVYTLNLNLTPGTWIVDAMAGLYTTVAGSTSSATAILKIDGTTMQAPAMVQTGWLTTAGLRIIVVTTTRNVPITIESGGGDDTTYTKFIKGLAFKTT